MINRMLLALISLILSQVTFAQPAGTTTTVAQSPGAPPETTVTTSTTVPNPAPIAPVPAQVVPPGTAVLPAPLTPVPPTETITYKQEVIPSIAPVVRPEMMAINPLMCPPASAYPMPAGYRLAGISPNCFAVPVQMDEPWP